MMEWLADETPFLLFGRAHLAALALTCAGAIAVAWAGRRLRGRPEQRWLSRAMALLIVVCQGGMQLETMLPGNFQWRGSLPLQLCDVAWIIAVYALWTHRIVPFGLVYYWGLSATVLAMITPDLRSGFPHFHFWMFYFGHAAVVAASVYLCWGVGLRPTWRLYRLTCLVTAGFATALYFLNGALETNYMYLNEKPLPGTMLDFFGPYPFHIVVCTLIALVSWALLTWPWDRGERRADSAAGGYCSLH